MISKSSENISYDKLTKEFQDKAISLTNYVMIINL